ncbi:hypothetical protein SteCoe_19211 [Stentor coeruleus]|uniref:Uncharacterized protein n=1 Tax=Stentor coeruleus TaxID=5963 RepID=A0A1R2BVA9_9CILI|nr:hypothetical protein SteCoe_19211 [Stentor coeruleus]
MESPKLKYFNIRVNIIEAKKASPNILPNRSPKQVYFSALKRHEFNCPNIQIPIRKTRTNSTNPQNICRDTTPKKLYDYYLTLSRDHLKDNNKHKVKYPIINTLSTKSKELISPFQNSSNESNKREFVFPPKTAISVLPFLRSRSSIKDRLKIRKNIDLLM